MFHCKLIYIIGCHDAIGLTVYFFNNYNFKFIFCRAFRQYMTLSGSYPSSISQPLFELNLMRAKPNKMCNKLGICICCYFGALVLILLTKFFPNSTIKRCSSGINFKIMVQNLHQI